MKQVMLGLAAAWVLAAGGPAAAQDGPVRPAEVNDPAVARLVQAGERQWQEYLRAEAQQIEVAGRALNEANTATIERLREALAKQPGGEAMFQARDELLAEQDRIEQITELEPRRQAVQGWMGRVAETLAKYREVTDGAWQVAGLDPRQLAENARQLLAKYRKGKFQVDSETATVTGALDSGAPAGPSTRAWCFRPPFTLCPVSAGGFLATKARGIANLNNGCTYTENRIAVVGGCNSRASVGVPVTVPAGYTKLVISANAEEIHEGYVLAILSGASSGSGGFIQVVGPDGAKRIADFRGLETWVPIVGADRNDSDYRGFREATFTIPNTGGIYLVTAGCYGYAWNGGISGVAIAWSVATTSSLCVDATR